jgi:hypothetical protein
MFPKAAQLAAIAMSAAIANSEITGHGILVLDLAAEEFHQIVVTADPPTIDEGLRGALDIMLRLECVRFFPAGEVAIVDLITLALE